MDDHAIYLCDKLQDWVNQINLKFTYKNYITIDLWDYFPLLKQGKCYRSTFNYLVNISEILCTDKSSSKFRCQLLVDKVGFHPLDHSLNNKDNIINKLDKKIIQELIIERLHIYELCNCFDYMQVYQNNFIMRNESYNQLCQLLISFERIHVILGTNKFNENDKCLSLFEKLLSNQIIKLIFCILACDEIKISSCLNTEKIDPRCHNNVLYLLSIDQNIDMIRLITFSKPKEQTSLVVKNKISNMIRDIVIKRNWYERQVLTNSFELLIGLSEIPDNIFLHMNMLK